LQKDHEILKGLVVEIVDAARLDDQVRSKAAIIKAASAAGLDVTDLPVENRRQGPSANTPSDLISGVEWNALALDCASTPQNSSLYNQSGRMSPRFDYGLCLDLDQNRCIKIFQPPVDTVPYVGPGMHTVRAKIVWACLEHAYACLQEVFGKRIASSIPLDQVTVNDPCSLPPNSAARIFFDRVLRHSVPLHDVAHLAAMTEARVEFRKLGYMRGDNPGAHDESSQILYRRVLEDYLNKGLRSDEWLSVLEVERYIEQKLGVYEFAMFEAAISCEESDEMELLRPLTLALTQSFICFGDGPRWKADHAAWMVDTWVDAVAKVKDMRKGNLWNKSGIIMDSGLEDSNL
jgi:hypothetical protein